MTTMKSNDDASSSRGVMLRVKRPRHVDSVSILQFNGKKRMRQNDLSELTDLIDDLEHSATSAMKSKKRKNKLIWKRIEEKQKLPAAKNNQYVDAELNHFTEEGPSKRQRLALTLTSSASPQNNKKKRQRNNTILDPLTRLVQDSLTQVRDGSSRLSQYINFLENDNRMQTEQAQKWIVMPLHDDNSNVLHLAALWNDVEACRHVLMQYQSDAILDAANADGQRPYQVAQAAGHEQVAQVLAAFGADTNDYVYDVFYLSKEDEAAMDSANVPAAEPAMVELRGGVGYFDENGQLILEAMCPEDFTDEDAIKQQNQVNNDDDVDSNAEDHEFNDYPEEENYSDDDEWQHESDFRHRPIYMPPGTHIGRYGGLVDDADEAAYDAQYGLHDGQQQVETTAADDYRDYAYDPEYDDDDEGALY